ncbi:PQQ-dependent sugar dehydrogenase [Blastococcus sp. URHD0036]|uniref:PQQ-dependent sugar dehydrogenase n=1 Tax=Blastococcus sp. URHD0036 TaxID=1380356 RepID=UPI00049600F5|nr:PQQ-dependent sugar dehydrogenase [Blastococcus sp. URHD0036]
MPRERRAAATVVQLALRVGVVLALVAGVLAVLPGAPASAAPSLPAGFVVRDLPSGQSDTLTDFDSAPDGSWFTTGKNGRVAWVSAAGGARTLATLPVVTQQDLGLTGIAVPADYPTSRQVYTSRTLSVNGVWTARLSAWTVTGSPEPTGLAAERVVLELRQDADVHGMTDIVAAPDGTLWVSMGDAADFRVVDPLALRAHDIEQGHGKLLHLLPDGRGVPSNPYFDAAAPQSWKSRVYASGFRSPFRLSLDPTSGAPVLGDVGWNTWEEVDLIRPGADYGWPCWEGDTQTPGYRDLPGCQGATNTSPLWTYPHGPLGSSVTGGVVYTGSSYPEAYRGAYFFGDYASQRVYTLRYDAQGRLTRQPEAAGFGAGNGLPVAFGTAANGDVVYADIAGSTLKRLVYLPGNRPPTAEATFTTNAAARTVSFDAARSTDLDGDPLGYAWDFGDGTIGTGVRVDHTYAATTPTTVTVRLTVTDPQGGAGTRDLTVAPAAGAPDLVLTAPPPTATFGVGEPVRASATATDSAGAPLPVTWRVVLVHCSADYCHDHPGESFPGPTFDRPFDDHGDQTRLTIIASATDAGGVRTERSFVAQPRLRTLTLAASTPAATTVNGVAQSTVPVTAGARVSISAPTVAADGVATFERWDDGAPRQRDVVMPDADVVLTSTYLTPIDRRYDGEAALRALLGPATGAEAGDAAVRYRVHESGRLYWSPEAGVHEVHGAILGTYLGAGGHVAFGEPTTDETTTPDGRGRYNHFRLQGASVYWTPETGARAVYGEIRQLWSATGWERGPHGYPRSSEQATPNGRGRYNDFQNGGIYWRPGVGPRSVLGAIYAAWGAMGWEGSRLGFPVTDETATPDTTGRYSHFEGGSIYWTPRTGAHPVYGAILDRWRGLGWERSYLGYPTSGEYAIGTVRRQDFERGYVTADLRTGAVVDRRY